MWLMCCQKQLYWGACQWLTWKCSAPFHQGFCKSQLAPSAQHRQNLPALACLLRHFPSQPQLVGTAWDSYTAFRECKLPTTASYRYIPQHIDQEESQHSLLNKSKPKRIKMMFYANELQRLPQKQLQLAVALPPVQQQVQRLGHPENYGYTCQVCLHEESKLEYQRDYFMVGSYIPILSYIAFPYHFDKMRRIFHS